MTLVNHLKGIEAQNLFLEVAYGKHVTGGNLAKSVVTGSDPTHVITLQNMLGRGQWDGCEGLWFLGVEVPESDYIFYPGTQSTGMSDVIQGQSAVFDTDTPHSSVAWIEAELQSGFGDFDTKNNPPYGLEGIFRTSVIEDYNSSGTALGASYSASPAREVADLLLRIGGRPSSRIDWSAWCDWRDFLATNISYDYTAISGFQGFGLSGSFYNGVAFDTLVSERIDPVIEFVSSAGSPGIGVDVDDFSVRWEGKIKALYSEDYTFHLTHTHGAKLWIDGSLVIDQWAASGAHSSSAVTMNEGDFYDIKVEWKHTTGNADIKLEWESDTTQDREVIPHRALYPKTVSRPRYETHPFWAGPTRLDDAVRTILNLCNSTVQEVNGKLRFLCLEQMGSPLYHFTSAKIVDGSLKVVPRDPMTVRNSWQARFRDIDSQYLEFPLDPVLIERPTLIDIAGRKIDGESIELFNCSMHQGHRTLENIVKRNVDSEFDIELTGMPDTFAVLAGDRVQVDVEFLDWTEKDMLVLASNDASSEDTAEERTFSMQEWTL